MYCNFDGSSNNSHASVAKQALKKKKTFYRAVHLLYVKSSIK